MSLGEFRHLGALTGPGRGDSCSQVGPLGPWTTGTRLHTQDASPGLRPPSSSWGNQLLPHAPAFQAPLPFWAGTVALPCCPLAPSAQGPGGHSQTDRLPVWTEASPGAAGPGVSAAWRLFPKPAWQHLGTGHSGCSGRGAGGQAPPPTPGGWQTLSRVSGRTGSPCCGVRLQPWPDSSAPESAAPARLAPPWGLGAGRVGCPRGHRLGQLIASHRPGFLASKGRSGLLPAFLRTSRGTVPISVGAGVPWVPAPFHLPQGPPSWGTDPRVWRGPSLLRQQAPGQSDHCGRRRPRGSLT